MLPEKYRVFLLVCLNLSVLGFQGLVVLDQDFLLVLQLHEMVSEFLALFGHVPAIVLLLRKLLLASLEFSIKLLQRMLV